MKLTQDHEKWQVIYERSNFLFWYHSLVACAVPYSYLEAPTDARTPALLSKLDSRLLST